MQESEKTAAADPRASCVGILLAAGFGRRYAAAGPAEGPEGAKLLARLPDGSSVAWRAAMSLNAITSHTLAVTRPDTEVLHAQLRSAGCDVLTTPLASRGMGASLAAGARHLLAGDAGPPSIALIALADMPWIRHETYADIVRAAPFHAIVVPTFQGRRGHPVAMQRSLWAELATLDGDVGARALLARHPVFELSTEDAGILRDVDVPQDLT